jgi:hemolysin activation/secretion protein
LDAFSAKSDLSYIRTTQAHNQYQAAKLYGYYNTNFNIPKTTLPLNYMLTFDSQFSEDALQGTQKFSLGGQYSIRGFENNAISGDNGYAIKNDLKINTIHLFSKNITNSKLFNFGRSKKLSISNLLSKSYLSVFYDYGYVRDKLILGQTNEGTMSGVGTKLSYFGQYLNWNLTFSKGLHSPKFIQNIYDQTQDNETIYFDVTFNIGLF